MEHPEQFKTFKGLRTEVKESNGTTKSVGTIVGYDSEDETLILKVEEGEHGIDIDTGMFNAVIPDEKDLNNPKGYLWVYPVRC